MYVSGTNDPEVPYNGGYMSNPAVEPIVAVEDAVQFWVDHNNCSTEEPVVNIPDYVEDDSSTVDMYDYTDCDAAGMVRFFKVNNGGHTWPGVEIPDMEPLLGETNEDIHASFQLWNFFKEYSLSEIPTKIDETEKRNYEIRVYPNPLTDKLILESSQYLQNYFIYNNTGILLNSGKITLKKREVVDVSDLSKGFYILKMVLGDNSIVTRKLVK
jgi:polyhydroxybutyrate depolymerase